MSRVLVVGRGAPDRGGIAAYLTTLLGSEVLERHDLTFLNLTRRRATRGGRLDLVNLRRTAEDGVAIWRAARGQEVLHVHTALSPLVTMVRASLFAALGRVRGAAVVVHGHGGAVGGWARSAARRRAMRALLRPATVVVAVAESVAVPLRTALGDGRVVTLQNGVDLERFAPTAASDDARRRRSVPRVLYAGLLTPRKGVLDLLDASTLLRQRGVDHELWLVGGTPDEGGDAEQQVLTAVAGTPGAVLLGVRDHGQMPDVYREVDVFCLPSWWEATPLTILEAMASGLPVVATRTGDVPAMVHEGSTGYIVDVRRPDALADVLGKLLSSHELRVTLGAAGRRRVGERYDLRRSLAAVAELYDGLTDATRGGPG